ncbi:MAG: hypothetical protein Q7S58_04670 [Candidatus Binatus sp.]|uniref:hypothetical protein n=1 Tax=Candidatus Binatus sp. TaxID=2811406 RepID=UPI002725F352|nr:hypothetical protein [Candidatus Binatus sp.]MDO8431687.1 hypothetical protein [Candidatus Binatus sp.]
MEVRRALLAGGGPASRHDYRIIEHELDMVRRTERPPVVANRISRILNWLMPTSGSVGPPMRSVARELEEAFPASDH